MDLAAIREAVAGRLAEIPDVRAFAFPPDQTPSGSAVAVVVAPGEAYIDYHEAFAKGLAIVGLTLSPYVQMADARSAWATFDELCSSGAGHPRSIIDALMDGDRTLGGVCADLVIDEVRDVQPVVAVEGARYLTGNLNMRVYVGRA